MYVCLRLGKRDAPARERAGIVALARRRVRVGRPWALLRTGRRREAGVGLTVCRDRVQTLKALRQDKSNPGAHACESVDEGWDALA